jgi:photosystem II stability/assembly factor-like uncharacterized protein
MVDVGTRAPTVATDISAQQVAACHPAGEQAVFGTDDRGTAVSAMASPTPHIINAIVGTAANDAWAVGAAGTVLHWDGTGWTAVNAGTNATLNDVAPISANDVWIVGANGTLIHFDGTTWTPLSVTSQTLYGAWPDPPGKVFVAGGGGTVLHLAP